MIGSESVKYSLRNMKQRKSRNFLTVFSIFMGIATIFIFISFGLGLYNYVESFKTSSSADKLMIVAKGAGAPGLDDTFKLTEEDLDVVQGAGGVYEASGSYYEIIQIKQRSEQVYVFLVSYDPKIPLMLELSDVGIREGRLLKSGDSKSAVFGYNFMLDNKIFKRGMELNDVVEINGVKIKAIGFMEPIGNPGDDSNVYVTNDYFLEIFPEKESYAQIMVRADIDNMQRTIENIEKKLRKHRNQEEGKEDFYVQSFEELLDSFSGALNIVIGFVILIALISVVVSAVNTANTMITSVLERYKEIGILKAIGSRNSDIFGIFLFESSFLGLIAGTIGVFLGAGIAYLGGVILESLGWGFLQPYFSFWLFAGLILFAVITGAISGVIPAWRASRINTVDALRYEWNS